jgi:hypothetical protein
VEWSHEVVYQGGFPPTDDEVLEIGGTSRTEFVDVWRDWDIGSQGLPAGYGVSNQGVISTPTPDASGAGDIAGTAMDSNGEPVSAQHAVSLWTIRHQVTTLQQFPLFDFIKGKRNAENFLMPNDGGGIGNTGKVLYLGYSFSEVVNSDDYDVVHEFAYDDWYHLRQVQWRDPTDGQPGKGAVGGDYENRAYPVYMVQPFRFTTSFEQFGFNG